MLGAFVVSKSPAKNSSIIRSDENYKGLLNELRSILEKGQNRAYKAVDNIKVQTYWQIGERIVREEIRNKERAEYGKNLIDILAEDMGLKRQRLYEIVKFYRCYEIVRTVSGQLSWNHYLELIKLKNDNKRIFFQKKAIEMSWSVRELRNQIKNDTSENRAINETLKPATTKLSYSNPVELFKSEYDLGFAGNYVSTYCIQLIYELARIVAGNLYQMSEKPTCREHRQLKQRVRRYFTLGDSFASTTPLTINGL